MQADLALLGFRTRGPSRRPGRTRPRSWSGKVDRTATIRPDHGIYPRTRIRPARDQDAAGIIDLIGSVFAEYPGCVLDVDGEMPELRRIASHFEQHEGAFWVAEDEQGIVGCIGLSPSSEPGGVELKKLYVRAGARTRGLGGKLAGLVEAEAARRSAAFIDLWSDTRFETAHRFYTARGYVRGERTRELFDKSATVEYYFRRELAHTVARGTP